VADPDARVIEEILGSRGKVKILRVIYGAGDANITRIVRETGMNHRLVSKHLRDLVEKGVLEERIIGRARLYTIYFANPLTLRLRDIFSAQEI
jgi:predicted transcriptional regulator